MLVRPSCWFAHRQTLIHGRVCLDEVLFWLTRLCLLGLSFGPSYIDASWQSLDHLVLLMITISPTLLLYTKPHRFIYFLNCLRY
jgi:hypothetical protein